MTDALKDLVDRLASWPLEDIEELDGYAREIEARRTGVYHLTDDERAEISKGLDQANRGEFVPDEDVEAFWKRSGVK
jgi:predicted transcriptional regulator